MMGVLVLDGDKFRKGPVSSDTSLAIIGAIMATSQNVFSGQRHLPKLVLIFVPLVLIRQEVQLCGFIWTCV